MAKIKHPRKKIIPVMMQMTAICSKYPDLVVSKNVKHNKHELFLELTPSEKSRKYLVKIELRQNKRPRVYIVSPNIVDENPEKHPPHMHSFERGQICLFLPDEVSGYEKYTYIIPWISEWLFFYEAWKITGKWYGRGHGSKEKQND